MIRPKVALVLFALSTLLLAGCVYSVHPLDQAKPPFVVSGFVGTWTTPDEDGSLETITIREPTPGNYQVVYPDPKNDRNLHYSATLVRVGEVLFADTQLLSEGEKAIAELPAGAVGLHMFWKISMAGDKLTVSTLSQEWLSSQFGTGALSAPHEDLDEATTILTGSPPKLQQFLREIAGQPKAFTKEVVFTRKK